MTETKRETIQTVDNKDKASHLCDDKDLEDALVAVNRRYGNCSPLCCALLCLQLRHKEDHINNDNYRTQPKRRRIQKKRRMQTIGGDAQQKQL